MFFPQNLWTWSVRKYLSSLLLMHCVRRNAWNCALHQHCLQLCGRKLLYLAKSWISARLARSACVPVAIWIPWCHFLLKFQELSKLSWNFHVFKTFQSFHCLAASCRTPKSSTNVGIACEGILEAKAVVSFRLDTKRAQSGRGADYTAAFLIYVLHILCCPCICIAFPQGLCQTLRSAGILSSSLTLSDALCCCSTCSQIFTTWSRRSKVPRKIWWFFKCFNACTVQLQRNLSHISWAKKRNLSLTSKLTSKLTSNQETTSVGTEWFQLAEEAQSEFSMKLPMWILNPCLEHPSWT